jgi:hypothetical protein
MSHALDCQFFHLDPAGPHMVNVLLHALNALLLFWVLKRATGFTWRSFMVAALFALHPINVESVAWVAERKNVLSMLFFLLALGAYRWYASNPQVVRYVAVAALFTLGLMAKPQVITFPCVLLLWDFWPLRRMFPGLKSAGAVSPDFQSVPSRSLVWLVIEKIPLLMTSAASAIVTIKVQHDAKNWYPRPLRVENAILSYVRYIGKAFWPTKLTVFYPHLDTLRLWEVWLSGFLLLAITVLVLVGYRYRYLSVGWLWFVGTLVPMIGIVQVGVQAMADRYAYTSFLGLFVIVCWGLPDWWEDKRLPKMGLAIAGAAVLLVLSAITYRQISYWGDNLVIWTHSLEVTPDNWLAEDNLGGALLLTNQIEKARPHYEKALAMNPSDTDSTVYFALYTELHGNYDGAIAQFNKLLGMKGLDPSKRTIALKNLAYCYDRKGDKARAQDYLHQASQVVIP